MGTSIAGYFGDDCLQYDCRFGGCSRGGACGDDGACSCDEGLTRADCSATLLEYGEDCSVPDTQPVLLESVSLLPSIGR